MSSNNVEKEKKREQDQIESEMKYLATTGLWESGFPQGIVKSSPSLVTYNTASCQIGISIWSACRHAA